MILVTGGAGYVGAHVCAALARAGRRVAVFDSFATSDRGVIDRLARLVGPLPVIEGDVRDAAALDRAFAALPVSAVVHLAGL